MASISDVPRLRGQVDELSRELSRELDALRRRVTTLEAEISEERRLHHQVEGITDAVERALLAPADPGQDRRGPAPDNDTDTS